MFPIDFPSLAPADGWNDYGEIVLAFISLTIIYIGLYSWKENLKQTGPPKQVITINILEERITGWQDGQEQKHRSFTSFRMTANVGLSF